MNINKDWDIPEGGAEGEAGGVSKTLSWRERRRSKSSAFVDMALFLCWVSQLCFYCVNNKFSFMLYKVLQFGGRSKFCRAQVSHLQINLFNSGPEVIFTIKSQCYRNRKWDLIGWPTDSGINQKLIGVKIGFILILKY